MLEAKLTERAQGRIAKGKGRARESKTLTRRRARMMRRRLGVALAITLALGAIAGAAILIGPSGGGLNTSLHQHVELEIYHNGVPVEIPTNIGIDPQLWSDHSLDEYADMEAMSPIHTHDGTGLIHLEMSKWHPFELGDLFKVWGQPFSSTQVLSYSGPVTMTVNGEPNEEFEDLLLQDGQFIVIRAG